MVGKKLERWCDTVRTRAENMLPSSLNTPTGALLLSSEILNVLTMLEHSATMTESVSDNDSERDGEDDNNVSENGLEIVGEQSGIQTQSPAEKQSCHKANDHMKEVGEQRVKEHRDQKNARTRVCPYSTVLVFSLKIKKKTFPSARLHLSGSSFKRHLDVGCRDVFSPMYSHHHVGLDFG